MSKAIKIYYPQLNSKLRNHLKIKQNILNLPIRLNRHLEKIQNAMRKEKLKMRIKIHFPS